MSVFAGMISEKCVSASSANSSKALGAFKQFIPPIQSICPILFTQSQAWTHPQCLHSMCRRKELRQKVLAKSHSQTSDSITFLWSNYPWTESSIPQTSLAPKILNLAFLATIFGTWQTARLQTMKMWLSWKSQGLTPWQGYPLFHFLVLWSFLRLATAFFLMGLLSLVWFNKIGVSERCSSVELSMRNWCFAELQGGGCWESSKL